MAFPRMTAHLPRVDMHRTLLTNVVFTEVGLGHIHTKPVCFGLLVLGMEPGDWSVHKCAATEPHHQTHPAHFKNINGNLA